MNILFVLYGDLGSNSANPLALYAREFDKQGHNCTVAIPSNLESIREHTYPAFRTALYSDALSKSESLFPDGRPADVIHAWTPRENVRHFVTSYMAKHPAPLVMYLEDHESWISHRALGLEEATIARLTDQSIAKRLPKALSHPFRYDSFIGLADAVVVIQDKLKIEVPPWVYCETVMPGVDLELFSPRMANPILRKKYGVADNEKVIVYPGGLNGFTKPAIETLCRAVGLLNRQGFPCRLLRTGPFFLDFIDQLPPEAAASINDLGVLPRSELPELLALADIFVQPGKIDPFEDLRLPGKLPELLAMGRPVVMPDVNIAHLFKDDVDAVLTHTGSAEEIAAKCIGLFSDPQLAGKIGHGGRLFAERHFNLKSQANLLAHAYKIARDNFSLEIATKVWQNSENNTTIAEFLAHKLDLLADLHSVKFNLEAGAILKERAQYIKKTQLRLNGLETEMADKATGFAQALHDKDVHIDNLDLALAEIHGSTSWRLTRPLRYVSFQISRIKTTSRALSYALPMIGGYRGLINRVWKIFKNEGIGGIKHRILFFTTPGARQQEFDNTHSNNNIFKDGEFDEAIYLAANPDVAASVAKGDFKSGWDHYQEIGEAEGRISNQPAAASNNYVEWVRRFDTLNKKKRAAIHRRIALMENPPLISVVMPVYNPPLNMLEEAIRSVQSQLYSNWELCIADDASTDVQVHKLLQEYAETDSRIRVVFRKANGHICAASNSALELVNGDYVALLDNDDLLSEHALFWVADTIIAHPDAGLIYSDEDKIDQTGLRYHPYFKSDWNPDLFLSHNIICHLGAYRTDLIKKLGGFREGYEGAQDYDLALRCTEQLTPQQIVHIPKVLYHWRSHPGSTAKAGSEKNYALLAGERALNDHFARINVSAKAELLDFGMYRARYSIPAPAPLVSLIIPTRNGLKLIKQCIDSIFAKTTYENYEILIVDNNSDDPKTLAYFATLAGNNRIRIIRDERPFNYSSLNNAAVGQARGEYLGLINNDIEVISPEWLDEMMSLAIQPGVGAVGARLWYPNDILQHGGVITGLGGVAGHSHKYLKKGAPGFFNRARLIQTMSAVTAACLVIKKSIYQQVCGLDEINLKIAFNDVDFCLRVREAGYRNIWTPYAELYHHESATRGTEDTPEKQLRFKDEVLYMRKRWGNTLMNDPAYNPNLTVCHEDFSFAWPPRV